MADNEYCENCGGECDGCCGGPAKKYLTEEEHAKDIVKMIISYGPSMVLHVLNELKKQVSAEVKN